VPDESGCHPKQQARCQPAPLAPESYCSASTRLLRWVFQRGNRFLTCQLDREGRRASYTLSLVPHWDVRQAVSRQFEAGASAFRHHAAVADELRRQGWTLAAYGAAR
jgi:hypothetical protein